MKSTKNIQYGNKNMKKHEIGCNKDRNWASQSKNEQKIMFS